MYFSYCKCFISPFRYLVHYKVSFVAVCVNLCIKEGGGLDPYISPPQGFRFTPTMGAFRKALENFFEGLYRTPYGS